MDLDNNPKSLESTVQPRMPDIYSSTALERETQPELINESRTEIDRSAGFDPYDTGVLQYKKNQN